MGKKSLLKSTSKKKNTKTKTDSDKEITPAGVKSDVKAAPKKAKASKKQAAAKAVPAKATPVETKKTEVKPEKPLSIKELVLKKFDTPAPGTLFTVKADDTARKSVMAPPFISGLEPAETERVRRLLFKTFDLSVPDSVPVEAVPVAPAVAEKAPKPKKKSSESPAAPVLIPALLKQKFDIVVPAKLYVPPISASGKTIVSPPFVAGLNPAETERVRKLLFKAFDLSVPELAPAEAAPVSIDALLKQKFDIVVPAKLYMPPVTASDNTLDSPPFVSGLDPAETERVRKLLFKTVDLSVPDPVPVEVTPAAPAVAEKVDKPEEKPPAPVIGNVPEPPAAPVSIEALLKQKFDIVAPATRYVPPLIASDNTIDSPPFVSGLDPAETERVRKLLFKTFDLSVPDPEPVEATLTVSAVAEEAPVSEGKTVEPELATPEEPVVPPDELPIPPQRPLPIGLDFPEPPTVPTMPPSNADVSGDQSAPIEPKKSMYRVWAGLDPVIKKAIAAGCGLALVFVLISIISFSNMSKYYLKNKGGAVEVWQGRFAPLGTDRIAVLPDVQMKKITKSALSRAEVAPLIVENFVSRADDLMVSTGTPNFKVIRKLLNKALSFAEDKAVHESILQRIDRIDMTALIFKATVSAEKDSRPELEAARDYLAEAVRLAREAGDKEMIQQKLKAVNDRIDAIPPIQKTTPAPAKPAGGHTAH
jgi:hypothetical protein